MEETTGSFISVKSAVYSKECPILFQGPTPPNSIFLIKNNLKELISLCLEDANLFTNSNLVKLKALQRLFFTVFYAQSSISPFFDKILKTIVKFQTDEDKEICNQVTRLAEIFGVYIDANVYIPIVLCQINDVEVTNSRRLVSFLTFMSSLIKYEVPKEIDNMFPSVVKTLEVIESNFKDDPDLLESMHPLLSNLIKNAGEGIVIYTRPLFSLLLSIQATAVSLSLPKKQSLDQSFQMLANKSGYSSVSELHSNEISVFLAEILQRKTPINWSKSSKERFKFEVIVRNCKEGIRPFLTEILQIIKDATNPANDIETRMDMLVLLEFLLELPTIVPDMKTFALFILTNILIPAAVWRAGKPQIKIRKAAVINTMHLIKKEIIDSSQLAQGFKDLLPVLKSCLDDDWAPDLRFATCQLMEKILVSLNQYLDSEQLRELYPTLLQRLDDAQDLIRIEITKTFSAFFACKNVGFSESNFEYLVRNIIVHLDDQNEEIQLAIYNILRFAARLRPSIVLTEGRMVLKKQKYPRKCQDLIKFAEELVEEVKEEEAKK